MEKVLLFLKEKKVLLFLLSNILLFLIKYFFTVTFFLNYENDIFQMKFIIIFYIIWKYIFLLRIKEIFF